MTARHFVLWVAEGRTHLASRSAYRRAEAGWRFDQPRTVPEELVVAHGGWEVGSPVSDPFPAFTADKLPDIVDWLLSHGFTARVLAGPPT